MRLKKNKLISDLKDSISFVEEGLKNYVFNKTNCHLVKTNSKTILIIGDCINYDQIRHGLAAGKALDSLIADSIGNFHAYELNKDNKQFRIFNSLFAILPLYYFVNNEHILFSNSFKLIKKEVNDSLQLNKKFILQNVLLNYSIDNDTYLKGISLVPSNSYLQVENDLSVKSLKYFTTEDLFVSHPKKGEQILSELTDVFIEESEKFLPDEKYAVSFTGGFDGRTLVALSNYAKRDFLTYSFGNIGSSDLDYPASQSVELAIEFLPVLLDENYANTYYKENLWEIVAESEGLAGINRSHYCYAANLLKEKTNFILTGNFGSEILRSLHITGAVFAKELFYVFKDAKSDEWIDYLFTSPKLDYLNLSCFKSELEETVSDIQTWIASKSEKNNSLLMYEFVLEELLRKYFGPEIVMQSNHLINRTPFLNIRFITELLKTKYAGAYGLYFSENPVKRFKGQELYAHIIAKTSRELLGMPTNKGYRPIDLLRASGKLKLVANFIRKKLSKAIDGDLDPFGVHLAFLLNRSQLLRENINKEYFNKDLVASVFQKKEYSEKTNFGLRLLSMNKYIAEING